MKLNKLLTPILGLSALSAVVAPLATSCTTETTTDHIKISNKSEEVTPNSSGVANYLFVLDSNEYDEHGFKVSTTVNEKDTSGVVDSDFITTWEIDGDHLLVHVTYNGEEEAPEDDVAIKLNIHINYGSEWNKTFDVKFNYQAVKGIPINNFVDPNYSWFTSDYHTLNKGENYTYIVDCPTLVSLTNKSNRFYFDYYEEVSTTGSIISYAVGFESLTVKLNGSIVATDNYTTSTSIYCPKGRISGIYFKQTFIDSLKASDSLVIAFEKCHVYKALIFSLGEGEEIDKLENAYASFYYSAGK